MKRLTLAVLCALAAATAPLYAQLSATVQEISGKVEIRRANGPWVPAALRMTLAADTTISTGFNSRAVLQIGLSRVTVDPLTRLLVQEVARRGTTEASSMTLRVGRINAVVKAAQGERSAFVVQGPASTAAVRGTTFSFDGYTLVVLDGVVVFTNLFGQSRDVSGGETSETNGSSYPASGEQNDRLLFLVPGPSVGGLLGAQFGQGAGFGGVTVPVLTGTVSVTAQ
jgi:hypothetical protein